MIVCKAEKRLPVPAFPHEAGAMAFPQLDFLFKDLFLVFYYLFLFLATLQPFIYKGYRDLG